MIKFRDRREAGQKLGARLTSYAGEHPIVLGLPRGGVVVAYEVARALHAPLDIWVVRKIGVPWHPELGVGAVAEGGFIELRRELVRRVGLSEGEVSRVAAEKRREVEERVKKFRGDRPRPQLRDRTVLLVDDGIATGGTVRAALRAIRAEEPKKVVLAVPVAAPEIIAELKSEAATIISLLTPADLYAIGLWYENFTQVSDEEVARLLQRARLEEAEAERPGAGA